jgi:hypothetical protein
MPLFIRKQAVPVVTLVLAARVFTTGVRLGPAEHPLKDGPAPEHAARTRIFGDDSVLNAEALKAVRQLQGTRTAANDQQRI